MRLRTPISSFAAVCSSIAVAGCSRSDGGAAPAGSGRPGGASDEFTPDAVKDVETWEATYHGIAFEGDAKDTMDHKRVPAQRPKGG